ncbi:MAG: sialate O-acetylesterase [Phycisphaerae bacterium]|nr:sialate O-acetylesterase [Phycisphaerae bacterium]
MKILTASAALACCITAVQAEVTVHHIFDSNMVLQRDKPVKIWGWATRDEAVSVEFGGQTGQAKGDANGAWSVQLDPMKASGEGRSLVVKGPSNAIELKNVLVGDIWLCGGQSNMEDVLESIYHGDVEVASAHHPLIRLMTIPVKATPDAQKNFERLNEYNSWTRRHEEKGSWKMCSPETVNRFSAIGYIFGRRLHLAGRVPIGLIDNSVGGTTVEGWTSRQSLLAIAEAKPLVAEWDAKITAFDPSQDLAERVTRWEKDTQRRKAKGEKPQLRPEQRPGPAYDRNNPAASFNGMLDSFRGFALKGIIFNQGYNNALGNTRPNLYTKTFQAMIGDWRRTFGDEKLPFGIVALTAGAPPQTMDNFELKMVDAAPYIREAQFKAYRELEGIGWTSAYDQQVPWYHPHKKLQLGERLARWALATQYGIRLGHEPAICTESKITGDRIVLTFDRLIKVQDNRPIAGMAIAGEDRNFYAARAAFAVKGKDKHGRDQLDYQRVEVWSPLVAEPKAVRYAWARCPLGNLANSAHHERFIPVPSFRTDDWGWEDAPFGSEERSVSGRRWSEARKQAEANMKKRKLHEARDRLAELEAASEK